MAERDRKGDMQGEGDRRSARRYNEEFRKSRDAGRLEGRDPSPGSSAEADELEQAEREGKRKAKEFDPQVRRDWSEPDKDD